MPEGSVTSETALAEQLDMSRTPVRAALQQLETEGFLRIVPKHGVLILPSSAQRVSDLLETMIALILFTYEQNKTTRQADMAAIADGFLSRFSTSDPESPDSLSRHEGEMWMQWITLSHNEELSRLLHATMNKLRWHGNVRRWKTPYRTETERSLGSLLATVASSEHASPCMFAYLHLLKKTWI
jgi:DNA-binding GntR family transcriptional regulator